MQFYLLLSFLWLYNTAQKFILLFAKDIPKQNGENCATMYMENSYLS